MEWNKDSRGKTNSQCKRYDPTEPQLSFSDIFLNRALDGEGLFSQGGELNLHREGGVEKQNSNNDPPVGGRLYRI